MDAQNRGIQRARPNQAHHIRNLYCPVVFAPAWLISAQIKTGRRRLGFPHRLIAAILVLLCQANGKPTHHPARWCYKSTQNQMPPRLESCVWQIRHRVLSKYHAEMASTRSLHRIAGRDGMHEFVLRLGVK